MAWSSTHWSTSVLRSLSYLVSLLPSVQHSECRSTCHGSAQDLPPNPTPPSSQNKPLTLAKPPCPPTPASTLAPSCVRAHTPIGLPDAPDGAARQLRSLSLSGETRPRGTRTREAEGLLVRQTPQGLGQRPQGRCGSAEGDLTLPTIQRAAPEENTSQHVRPAGVRLVLRPVASPDAGVLGASRVGRRAWTQSAPSALGSR